MRRWDSRLCAFGYASALLLGSGCGGEEPAPADLDPPVDAGTDSEPPAVDLTLRFEEVTFDEAPVLASDFAFIPGTDEFLIVEKSGRLLHYELNGDEAALLGSVQLPRVYDSLDCGVISLALAPDFEQTRMFYIGKCVSQTESGIYGYELFVPDYADTTEREREILLVGDPRATRPWHNVGSIGFDPQGRLWAVFGEKTQPDEAQNLDNYLGTLVSIDLSGNVQSPGEPPPIDVLAYGLRSPFRATLDSRGRYWIADVGSSRVEEINVVTDDNQNFGWPFSEGPCQVGCEECPESCEDLRDPILHWGRSFDEPFVGDDELATPANGRVAFVGLEYLGRGTDRYDGRLTERVIFGEYCVGFVRAARLDEQHQLIENRHLGHLDTPSAWREGEDGYVYAMTLGRCQTDVDNPSDSTTSRLYRALANDGQD